jgi:hypothetical protein
VRRAANVRSGSLPHTSRGEPHVSVWRRGRLMAKAKPANVAFGSHEAEASAAGVAPVRRALVGIGAVLSITSEGRWGSGSGVFFSSFAPGSPSGDPPPRPELTFSCPVGLPGTGKPSDPGLTPGSMPQMRQHNGASCRSGICWLKWRGSQSLPQAFMMPHPCFWARQVRRTSVDCGSTLLATGLGGFCRVSLRGLFSC